MTPSSSSMLRNAGSSVWLGRSAGDTVMNRSRRLGPMRMKPSEWLTTTATPAEAIPGHSRSHIGEARTGAGDEAVPGFERS